MWSKKSGAGKGFDPGGKMKWFWREMEEYWRKVKEKIKVSGGGKMWSKSRARVD